MGRHLNHSLFKIRSWDDSYLRYTKLSLRNNARGAICWLESRIIIQYILLSNRELFRKCPTSVVGSDGNVTSSESAYSIDSNIGSQRGCPGGWGVGWTWSWCCYVVGCPWTNRLHKCGVVSENNEMLTSRMLWAQIVKYCIRHRRMLLDSTKLYWEDQACTKSKAQTWDTPRYPGSGSMWWSLPEQRCRTVLWFCS